MNTTELDMSELETVSGGILPALLMIGGAYAAGQAFGEMYNMITR